ncbi:MAG: glycosyltransferase, partial [Jatrophihabitans sp.]
DGLLNPIHWPEPFGLVMAEALAAGVPVLAHPRGAAPEIVQSGRTGFLPADEAGLVASVPRLGELDRAACRAAAESRFSLARMAADHVRLYERVLTTGTVAQAAGRSARGCRRPPGRRTPTKHTPRR